MPYAPDNSNLMLPVASHVHQSYGGFQHFGPAGGYPPHATPPHPPTYKSELHDNHANPPLMNHGGLMPSTTLPSVSTVPVSSQPALSPISSLNGGNTGNEYHMSHHIHQHQANSATNATTYHHSPPLEHAQQLNQEVSNYSNTVSPVSMPSPPSSIPPSQSNLRFEIILEAPTAAAQRTDETPLTYLNKGQYYGFCIQDQDKFDGEFITTIKLMFHDDTHRKLASTYWSFWLTQQTSPKNARAIDIDKAASTGLSNVETKTFDRIQFRWHGKKGAKLFIRFSCLSTDFSRIKGVKGIPLRIQVETKSDNGTTCSILEKSFAKIKLFRDKGAERKNKDDQKHLEKMCEKMRGKTQETTPMIMMYAPPHSVTLFNEMAGTNDVSDDDDVLNLSESLNNLEDVEGGDLIPLPLGKRRRFSMGPDFLEPLDCDPTYIPHLRKRRAVLCIYVKLPGESAYRAVYLNHLTVQDLTSKLSDKLSEKIDLQGQQISGVFRSTKRNLTVRIDDDTIHQLEDETDMEVDVQLNQDGTFQLTLKVFFIECLLQSVAAEVPDKYELDDKEYDRINQLAALQLEAAKEDLEKYLLLLIIFLF
ncbi:299_t:CDS:2 [Funneliformis mosseae]|uniref:299_t:CDS:1 n=1 Tax=Funneliformis mosseae TaxID=27381 RepID=A0A9N8YTE3_FUNMO|nr:299_t:CDS:2 [Funneliformis mosseae]